MLICLKKKLCSAKPLHLFFTINYIYYEHYTIYFNQIMFLLYPNIKKNNTLQITQTKKNK